MKLNIILIALMAAVVNPIGIATASGSCVFGRTTSELTDTLVKQGKVRVTQSVDTKKYARTLSPELREMIRLTVSDVVGRRVGRAEALRLFNDEPHGNGRGSIEFLEMRNSTMISTVALVSYFPGDNEYGYIFTLFPAENAGSPGYAVVAKVSDGDITECTIHH